MKFIFSGITASKVGSDRGIHSERRPPQLVILGRETATSGIAAGRGLCTRLARQNTSPGSTDRPTHRPTDSFRLLDLAVPISFCFLGRRTARQCRLRRRVTRSPSRPSRGITQLPSKPALQARYRPSKRRKKNSSSINNSVTCSCKERQRRGRQRSRWRRSKEEEEAEERSI